MRYIDVNLKYTNSLVNDYLSDFSKVEELFNYNPLESQSWQDRYAYLMSRPQVDRSTVVRVLREYNLALGAGPKTLENIELLSNPETVVVVTGQQAGLLGGPLYTIYKALTTVQLARKYSEELNRPVIPVFWIAAEDHDFGEINHCHIFDRQGQPARIRLETTPAGKFSIGQIPVPPEIKEVFDQLAELSVDTEFKPELLAELAKAAEESANLADWFGKIMLQWLGSTGLVMLNPLDPELRQLETGLFLQAVDYAPRVNELLSATAASLTSKGYPVGVEKDRENVNLFMFQAGERLALIKTDEGYALKGTEYKFSADSLAQLIESEPAKFSPNVVLRPLTQEVVLPTLAYVAGPGEITYFSQYKEIFELFGLQMPIIYPRANLTLVEGNIENYLNKYKLGLQEVLYNLENIRANLLNRSDSIGIDRVFQELAADVAEAYAKALGSIKQLDPGLEKLGTENLERILGQVNWLKSKTEQAHRKSNDVAIRQLEKLGNSLNPGGNLQERYIGGIYFAVKYGESFFMQLNQLDLLAEVAHKLVFIKD